MTAKSPSRVGFFGRYLYLMRGYELRLAGMVGLFFLISFLDLIGIGLIGPFIGAVTTQGDLSKALLIGPIFRQLPPYDRTDVINVLGLVLVGTYVLKAVVAFSIHRFTLQFGFAFRGDLVRRLSRAYLYMPYRFYLERSSSSLVQSVLNNTKALSDDLLIPSLRLVADTTVIAMTFALLCFIDPINLGLLILFVGGALGLYALIARPRTRGAGKEVTVTHEQIIKEVNQALWGVKEVRTFGAEPAFLGAISRSVDTNTKALTSYYSLLAMPRYLMEATVIIVVILISLLATNKGAQAQALIPSLAMFAAAGLRILPALTQVSASIASLNYSAYALDAVYKDLRFLDEAGLETEERELDSRARERPSTFSSLSFEHVSFSYEGAAVPALNEISFELRHGQSIGLIGASGAGKTTLVDMLLGFHKPKSGRILVNGVDVESYGWRAWREQIAYLPQDASLLDDTIEANIAFGVPAESIDAPRVEKAIEWAQLSGLVGRLPEGRRTVIGEFGVRLSGGERQRLALARGFYFDRKVFILDEATSSLDTETEAQVIDVINRLHGEKTLIVIAHRLNTVRVCDLIYRLEKGRIVGSGRFEDIVDESGRRLVSVQAQSQAQ